MSGGAIKDLNAHHHPYVVFGNTSPNFDATEHGIEPLSVMAVVCNGQVIMAVMGDSNGGGLVGEAAISVGKLCFPNEKITGNSGHGDRDVLYIAFPGKAAVPKNAKWTAEDASIFEESLWDTGAPLLETLGGGAGNGTSTQNTPSKTKGHASATATPTDTEGEGSKKKNKNKNKEEEEEEDVDETEEKRSLASSRIFRGLKI
jgi:chitosanase